MSWHDWHARFEARARERGPTVAPQRFAPTLERELVRVLQRFQLGETGEGRIVDDVRRAALPGLDATWCATMRLFVAEEGRHAALLASMLRAMQAAPCRRDRAATGFRAARRLLGPRTELAVLLAAETVAVVFYAAVARALPRGSIASALEGIARDEGVHLLLHVDTFATLSRDRVARVLLRVAWWPLALAALVGAAIASRRLLRVLGVDVRELVATYVGVVRWIDGAIAASSRAGRGVSPRREPARCSRASTGRGPDR